MSLHWEVKKFGAQWRLAICEQPLHELQKGIPSGHTNYKKHIPLGSLQPCTRASVCAWISILTGPTGWMPLCGEEYAPLYARVRGRGGPEQGEKILRGEREIKVRWTSWDIETCIRPQRPLLSVECAWVVAGMKGFWCMYLSLG